MTAQIGDLNRCLDLISWKVSVYEERLAQGTVGYLWTGSGSETGDQH